MIDSNFIIWGSPVYTMQVSGQMKNFLDRLASWYHLLKLAGKSGMTVSTTAGNGLEEVQDYLGMMLCATGTKVVASLETYGMFPKTLRDQEKARKEAHKTAEKVYSYITREKQIETDEYLEQCFQISKIKVTKGAEWLPGDYKYWEENEMLELSSFNELLKKLNHK